MKKITLSVISIIIFCTTVIAQTAPVQSKFCEKKVAGYITNWADNSSVDYSGLTHAFFSFLKPASDGTYIEFTSEQEMALQEYLRKTKKYGCKRFISLGGGGDELFPVVAADPELRRKFIASVIEFCKERKFDGIDIDWEGMDNEAKKKNYTFVMKEFRTACNANNLQLTATIAAFGDFWCKWMENEALKQADWIQLMIYDQTGSWASSPFGNHATFEHVQEAEKYWLNRGFTKDILVIGLPFYGYRFNSRDGGQGTQVKYSEIASSFPSLKASDDQTPGEDLCLFNGPEMIKKKTTYALENGYAGVMVWEMSQDCGGSKSLHKAILEAFGEYCGKK